MFLTISWAFSREENIKEKNVYLNFQIYISAMVHMKGQQWHLSKKKFWMASNGPYFYINQDFFFF